MQKLKVALSHLCPGPLLSCAADVEWAKVTFSNHNKQVMCDLAGSDFLIQKYN